MVDPRQPAANDNEPAFTLTRRQLEELVLKAVRAAQAYAAQLPLLLDKQDMARQLGCSPKQLDLLRKRGLPCVPVGQLVRFEPAKVVAWLSEHGAA